MLADFDVGPIPFNITFTETPNVDPANQCDVTTSPTACNDIFVLSSGFLNSQFDFDAQDGDGLRTYFVNVFPTSGGVLSTLEDSACLAAGAGVGCLGFSTPENQSTRLDFGFTISTERIVQAPEPGVLAAAGFGSVGHGDVYAPS